MGIFNHDYDWMKGLPPAALLKNPLMDAPNELREKDELTEFYKLSNPFYSPIFGIKYIMNINLLEHQLSMILAMLKFKFPMLLLSRGAGKCVRGDTLVHTSSGMMKIEEVIGKDNRDIVRPESHSVFNGEYYENTAYSVVNAEDNTKLIRLSNGSELEGTPEHKIQIIDNELGTPTWRRLDEVEVGDIVKLSYGSNVYPVYTGDLSEDDFYFVGLMTGDGGLSCDRMTTLSSADDFIIESARKTMEEHGMYLKHVANYDYKCYGKKNRKYIEDKFDLNYSLSYDKEIPVKIRAGDKKRLGAFLSGLFDSDGGCEGDRMVTFCSVSKTLASQVQAILLNMGIDSSLREKKTNSDFGKAYVVSIYGENLLKFRKDIGFRLPRKKEQLDNICNRMSETEFNSNVDIYPFADVARKIVSELKEQGVKGLSPSGFSEYNSSTYGLTKKKIYRLLNICVENKWTSGSTIELSRLIDSNYIYRKVEHKEDSRCVTYDFNIPGTHSFVSNGMISHNTMMLAIYAVYHAVMFPNTRIILVSASFRQCVTGDTYIMTNKGMIRVDQLKSKPEYIVSSEGYQKCLDFWENEEQDTIKIKSELGVQLEGSTGHKILIVNGDGELEYRELKDVKEGDYSVVSKPELWNKDSVFIGDMIPDDPYDRCSFPQVIDEDLAYFMGSLVGDGCLTQKNYLLFINKEKEYLDIMEKLYCRYFNKSPNISIKKDGVTQISKGSVVGWGLFERFGLAGKKSYEKFIPSQILQSPKSVQSSFIRSLFDSDGGVYDQVTKNKVSFATTSDVLARQLQTALLNFGIIAGLSENNSGRKRTLFQLEICSKESILKFKEEIGFSLSRKMDKLNFVCDKIMSTNRRSNRDIIPNIGKHMREVMDSITSFRKENRVNSDPIRSLLICSNYEKSSFTRTYVERIISYCQNNNIICDSLNKLQSMIRSDFHYSKIVSKENKRNKTYDFSVDKVHDYFSNGLISHNSKLIFSEIKRIYDKAPILRSMSDGEPRIGTDTCRYSVCGSSITALPLGNGEKIRGERGHVIMADEFDSIDSEIFNKVIRGFGATQSDPWQKAKEAAQDGEEDSLDNEFISIGNKIILAGTAGYTNGPFYHQYKHYAAIIANQLKGKANEFTDLLGSDDEYEVDFRDYCIVKYRYDQLPEGMMDRKLIQAAKATMPKHIFDMEYNAEFADDSAGFFKARDLKEATANSFDGFQIKVKGRKDRNYIMGVDPARTIDRFSISIIEIGQPNKVVYHWTCQNKKYSFAAAKMRQLMRDFNVIGINMDSGGGGMAIEELLNIDKSPDGYDIKKDSEPKIVRIEDDSRDDKAIRILNMQAFNSSWIEEANSLLQKNIEDKKLMFPRPHSDYTNEEYEDIIYEISELKKELLSITVTYTTTGRKHFNLKPMNSKTDDTTKHKDRYSSLLLSNYMASKYEDMTLNDKIVARRRYNDDDAMGGWAEEFGSSPV